MAIIDRGGTLQTGVATSEVRLTEFSEQVLSRYLERSLWQGKAGAYGLQDPEAAPLIAEVTGSASNVKGLPLELALQLLAR